MKKIWQWLNSNLRERVLVAIIGAVALIIVALINRYKDNSIKRGPSVVESNRTNSNNQSTSTENIGRDKIENNYYSTRPDSQKLIPLAKHHTIKKAEPTINQTVITNNQQGGQTANEINNYK